MNRDITRRRATQISAVYRKRSSRLSPGRVIGKLYGKRAVLHDEEYVWRYVEMSRSIRWKKLVRESVRVQNQHTYAMFLVESSGLLNLLNFFFRRDRYANLRVKLNATITFSDRRIVIKNNAERLLPLRIEISTLPISSSLLPFNVLTITVVLEYRNFPAKDSYPHPRVKTF